MGGTSWHYDMLAISKDVIQVLIAFAGLLGLQGRDPVLHGFPGPLAHLLGANACNCMQLCMSWPIRYTCICRCA